METLNSFEKKFISPKVKAAIWFVLTFIGVWLVLEPQYSKTNMSSISYSYPVEEAMHDAGMAATYKALPVAFMIAIITYYLQDQKIKKKEGIIKN